MKNVINLEIKKGINLHIIKTNKFLLQSYCTITSIKYAK